MRFSYCIFDTFRVPGGRVRLAVSAGRQGPCPRSKLKFGGKTCFCPPPPGPQKKLLKRRFMLCIHTNICCAFMLVCQFNVNFVCYRN